MRVVMAIGSGEVCAPEPAIGQADLHNRRAHQSNFVPGGCLRVPIGGLRPVLRRELRGASSVCRSETVIEMKKYPSSLDANR